jgi:hypothetical protein
MELNKGGEPNRLISTSLFWIITVAGAEGHILPIPPRLSRLVVGQRA